MRAAVFDRHGPPEVVRIAERSTPDPGEDEVRVRIYATTICAPDWRVRSAKPSFVRLITPKHRILGMEFAGRVDAIGKRVDRFRVGDDVFGTAGMKFGAHAEYLCLPQNHSMLALKPSNMTHDEAAAVLFGGISALSFLRKAGVRQGVRQGQNVLIYGASGSVGVFAVQLAKHFGARVTGVCSTANVDLVRLLGADDVVDYTQEDFAKDGRVYDVIIDTVGKSSFRSGAAALKRGGVFAQVALAGWSETLAWLWTSMAGAAKLAGGVASAAPGDQALLTQLIEAGELRTVIDRRYTLDEIVEAHRHAEGGHKKGHVVVTMQPGWVQTNTGPASPWAPFNSGSSKR